jgi:CBS domain containing-hemolysin-like protein
MSGNGALLLAAGLMVLLAGFFAAAETALSRVSRVRIDGLADSGKRGARRVQTVITDPPRYLNLLLLIRVAAELTGTVLVALVASDTFPTDWRAILVAAGSMTVIDYVLVGVAPRTLGRQHAETISLRTAWLALSLNRILGPLPQLLILLGNALTPGRGFPAGPFSSEAELRDLIDVAEERQVIEESERAMLHSVFELGDTLVREVMVPRTDMVWIERDKSVRQALSLALRSGFSRIPVVGDNEDDVVGVAYLKDLVRRVHDHESRGERVKVDEIMRPPYFVPDSKPIDELLREMQACQVHLAVVIDEYGGTAGLVTIEDILEEIVGEITDEYDREVPRIEELDDGARRVNVRLPVDDIEELYGVSCDLDDVETVGGLLATALGRVPIPGATATLQGLTFTAEGTKGRRHRIGTVLIRPSTNGSSSDHDDVPQPEHSDA